ncbi:MAG: dTDP-4-dehydrorhamnose 3,5-epimerase [Granulosicoccus sp.]|nr:dTDP-4-dehydrorhamnose 3,5-epimerase [Granulosicoccus sp.]
MRFTATSLAGATIVDMDKLEDQRGFFARAFCQREFDSLGMSGEIVQANVSYTVTRGTVRGLHYQIEPAVETKLLRCTRGAIIDVIVDMRTESPTYREHMSVELTADNHRALFVPAMCAHGFQTLEDHTEVMYLVSGFHTPTCERGLRYDDPALNIHWPLDVTQISDKDAGWPLLQVDE